MYLHQCCFFFFWKLEKLFMLFFLFTVMWNNSQQSKRDVTQEGECIHSFFVFPVFLNTWCGYDLWTCPTTLFSLNGIGNRLSGLLIFWIDYIFWIAYIWSRYGSVCWLTIKVQRPSDICESILSLYVIKVVRLYKYVSRYAMSIWGKKKTKALNLLYPQAP